MVTALLVAVCLAAPEQDAPDEPGAEDAPRVEQTVDASPQEEPAEPSSDEPPAAIEVIVYGELLVQQAKEEVYHDLQEAGYTEVVSKDDKVIFRHPDPWKGEVHVYDDGWMKVRRQRLQVEGREMPWAERNTPLAWAGCVIWPFLCIRPGGQTLSQRKFRHHETGVTHEVQPQVEVWGERIADLSTSRKVGDLPDQLQALWEDGVPLVSETSLATYTERRQEILAFWETRTDTPWGEQVRAAVEAFCRGVVQQSDDPFSAEEIAAFNEQSTAGRAFDLKRQVATEEP